MTDYWNEILFCSFADQADGSGWMLVLMWRGGVTFFRV